MKFKILCILLVAIIVSPLSGKSLHFAIPYSFTDNYDPVENNYINLQPLFRSIYSTLFKLDSHLRPYPFLIEDQKKEGKRVIFRLKKNARFSNGSAITAEDAVRSIETGMKHTSFPNPVYKLIEGGEDLFKGKTRHCTGIKVLGPKSFEIRFKYENPEFPYYLTATIMSILPRERKREDMVFSGAFKVVNIREKKKKTIVTLKKNPYYIGKQGKIDTLYFHFYHRDDQFKRAVKRGEPELFLYNRHVHIPTSTYKYNYFKTPTFGGFYFKLNPKSGPFRDKGLRTFFKHFILSQDFAKIEKWELTAPSHLVLPYSLTGYFVFKKMKPGDVKAFMPRERVRIRCVNDDSGIRTTLIPLLKKKLKKYNIDLELQWDSLGSIFRREKKGDVDLTSVYYLVDIPLSSYFYENLFTPGHELNLFGYEVPKALKLLADYRKESDELKRLKILSHLEEIAQEEAIFVPFMNPLTLLGYKNHVKNVRIDKFLNIYFEDIDVEKRH